MLDTVRLDPKHDDELLRNVEMPDLVCVVKGGGIVAIEDSATPVEGRSQKMLLIVAENLSVVLVVVAEHALILLMGCYILNLGYGFEGSFQRLDDYSFVSETFGGHRDELVTAVNLGNRFSRTRMAAVPVPLPKNYVMGIDMQKWDFKRKMESFLPARMAPRRSVVLLPLRARCKGPSGNMAACPFGLRSWAVSKRLFRSLARRIESNSASRHRAHAGQLPNRLQPLLPLRHARSSVRVHPYRDTVSLRLAHADRYVLIIRK